MNFPTSLDNGTTLPNPQATDKQNSPDHAGLHTQENLAIIALETKVGIGSSTPASNTLLFGTGVGTSAWQGLTSAQLASVLSDETGTGSAVFANTPTLITPKVDTINESTLNNGVTVGGVNLKGGFMNGANLTAGSVGNSQVATGTVVQIVATNFSAFATGTTTIPVDDTVPQITEGTEFMTQAITPKSATNNLIIEVHAFVTNSAAIRTIGALFQDATANALAATETSTATATYAIPQIITHIMPAGTTSATTFRYRAGGESASTLTFNGLSGARFYGATSKSMIKITEVKV